MTIRTTLRKALARSSGRMLIVLLVGLLVCLPISLRSEEVKTLRTSRNGVVDLNPTVVFDKLGALAGGKKETFRLNLPQVEALDVRVAFDEAPFSGTKLSAQINGRSLLPYYAFGGDTRYDNIKGKPGARPPLAEIEGRWVIPPVLLKAGINELTFETSGTQPDQTLDRIGPRPAIRIRSVTVRRADGSDLPRFANSIYFDFDVWAQGFDWGPDAAKRHHFDLALLGAINGKGMPCITAPLGGSEAALWEVKRACENNVQRWGYGHQEFYTIWEFCTVPNLWAKFVDVDKNPETTARFHGQTIFDYVQNREPAAKGADLMLYDVEKYRKSLEPAIRMLAPYTDFYNFKCEQHGPWGQGFGQDGMRWAKEGIDGKTWASNYYEAQKVAHDLVRKYNPEVGRIQEIDHWLPGVRHFLFDTAMARKQPVGDMIDVLMAHFTMMIPYDLDAKDRIIPGETFERQYPGGKFDTGRNDWPGYLSKVGYHPLGVNGYPEMAIDFNRYRLGRSEKDITRADPAKYRWGNGKPFDFRAGLRGDELMYNSENGVYIGYSAPAAHQFLHGFFSYSLLPTATSEPRDLKLTERKSITETKDIHVNLYGQWVEGVGHTKRLRTVDPLYGDLFGWTGTEHCTTGDYIRLPGIKDAHHRLPPYDAYGLVRRTCYAFVTTGPVLPVYQGPEHSEELIVKCLEQVFDGQRYLGIYASNFDTQPHTLDVVLPFPLSPKTEALVFDDRAADWSAAKRLPLQPGKEIHYQQKVPGISAWLVLVPMPAEGYALALDLPKPPLPKTPVNDAVATDDLLTLSWEPGDLKNCYEEVQLSREALFRTRDLVRRATVMHRDGFTSMGDLPKGRYFWRAKSVESQTGRQGEWSAPQSVVYRWPEYSKVFPPQKTATTTTTPPAEKPPAWQVKSDEEKLEATQNLASQGEIFGTGGCMYAPSRAADAQAFSWWTNGNDESNSKFLLPAEWCVIWPKPTKFQRVKILWMEEMLPQEFIVQVSGNRHSWTDLLQGKSGAAFTDLKLKKPTEAKFFRLLITKASAASGGVGVREVVITAE